MKNPKQPSYMTLAILSVITVFFWIIFSVIRLIQKPVDTKVPNEILSPITPTLDLETLENVKNSKYYSTTEIGQNVVNAPVIENKEVPVSTESGGQ